LNWGKRKWDDLCSRLLDRKLSVGVVGHNAICPEGCFDYRGVDLETTVSLMKNSRLFVGESSGPMHLASLAAVKRFVWGYDENNAKKRYEELWNFHNSEVFFCDRFGHLPPVDFVCDKIIELLDE